MPAPTRADGPAHPICMPKQSDRFTVRFLGAVAGENEELRLHEAAQKVLKFPSSTSHDMAGQSNSDTVPLKSRKPEGTSILTRMNGRAPHCFPQVGSFCGRDEDHARASTVALHKERKAKTYLPTKKSFTARSIFSALRYGFQATKTSGLAAHFDP